MEAKVWVLRLRKLILDLPLAVLTAAAILPAVGATQHPLHLPLTLTQNNPVTSIEVAGHEIKIVVDTGGGVLGLSPEALTQAGAVELAGERAIWTDAQGQAHKARRFHVPQIRVGGRLFTNLDAIEAETIPDGPPVPNVLGREFLRQFIVIMDYPGRLMTLLSPDTTDAEAEAMGCKGTRVPFEPTPTAGRIEVPTYRLAHFDHRYRTFCSKRFDRPPRGRRFFVSAMTLLERRDGEGASYLEIADFIQNHGARGAVEADLEQLLRRVLFNVLVGNTDDHLRNHGFLREATGWRLAPAFDLNPNPSKRHHALRLNEASDEPDIDAVMSTAEFYRLSARDAQRLLTELLTVTRSWRKRAKAARLPASEIARIEPAFASREKR